ncbi:MAG: glutamine synthetase III, partial [Rubricoccaceae bacterium]|nr:glutamine synthetase III [Rubricoccaceae bacterium]
MPSTLAPSVRMNGNGHHKPMDVERIFGQNTFGLAEMKARLPKSVYKHLLATIRGGEAINVEVADAIALAMKEWA